MKLTIKYCLIFIFLCAQFLTKAESKVFVGIDSLINNQQYFDAKIECERIIYSSSDNSVIAYALLKKAQCSKYLNEFEEASKTLERVNFINLSDSLQYMVRYENALCSYLYGSFEYAEHQLKQINYFISDTTLKNNSILLNILVYNELKKWDESALLAKKFISLANISRAEKDSLNNILAELYSARSQPKLRKSKKARVLSTFLPGLGQVYAGYPVEGAFNTSLHLIFIGVAGVSIYYKYYLTGYFGGLGLLQKFYYGGITRTEYLTNKKNHIKLRKYNDNIRDFLIEI